MSLASYYEAYDAMEAEEASRAAISRMRRTALMNYMAPTSKGGQDGFKRMQACRRALDAIDRQGWQRSFHQRMFHDWFIRACARIFWKTEPLGSFAKNHQRILELNGWDHLSQEVLVSTPRRCLFFLVQAGLGPQGKGGTGSRAYLRQYSPNSRWGRREMKQGGQGGGMGWPSVSSGTSIVRALPGDAREFQQANARFFFRLGQVRQDHLGQHVRRGHAVQLPEPGDVHLQHVQAHLAEAPAQRPEVPRDHLHGARDGPHARGAGEHGGDRGARPRGPDGRPHGQLLPQQGIDRLARVLAYELPVLLA